MIAITLTTSLAACGSSGHTTGSQVTSSSATASSTATSPAASGALVARGKSLYTSLGCSSCHSLSGASGVGPTWKDLAGSSVALTNGQTVTANDTYLTTKIRNANATTVKGYPAGVMASTIKPGSVSVSDAKALVAFIDSLS